MWNKAIIINGEFVLKDVPSKPTILIDKSTLEILSNTEFNCLNRYYLVVGTHVLLSEIDADLKKEFNDERNPENVVSILADRLHGNSRFNTDWYTLLKLSLFGESIPVDHLAPVYLHGVRTYTPGIGWGVCFDEQQERKNLRNWADSEFSESDYRKASQWRSDIQDIDLTWVRDLGNTFKELKVKSWKELPTTVENILENPKCQFEALQYLVRLANVSEKESTEIFNRWNNLGMPSIQDFSQYGYYCLKTCSLFNWALFSGLIGPRATHCIDLQYLLELPFCRIFSSQDNLHKKFAPLLITDQQIFIEGLNLKSDLKRIEEHVDALNEEERTESFPFPYPPDWNDSFTNQLWKKYVIPREDFTPFTQEEKNEILERHKRIDP